MIQLIVRKLLLILIPIGGLVVFTNYIVDPANLFSDRQYVAGIASILSKGHNVQNISNYDERLLQVEMIARLKNTPDVIVFGSSRIMEVGSDFFKDSTVLNIAVSHANIHDLIALMGVLDSLHRIPKLMLINVDPGLVAHDGSMEWQSLSAYHDYCLARIGVNNRKQYFQLNKTRKFLSLASLEYFEKSLAFLASGTNKKYMDVGRERPTTYGRFFDGTVCYPSKYTSPDTLKVATDAKKTAMQEGMPLPDAYNMKLLDLVIKYLRSKACSVKLIMLPFQVDFYEKVNVKQSNLFNGYETLFHQLANKNGIEIKGGFNARDYNLPRSQFYDMYHCSKDAIKTVILN